MNTEAYGITVFCDDIRHEVNGKMTLVGCYLAEMNFNGPAPGVLPTFAALVNIRIPLGIEFTTLTLRVIKEIGEDEVEEIFKADAEVSPEDRVKALSNLDNDSGDAKIAVLTFPVRWSPLEFAKPGFVKVRAYMDGGHEIKAGSLKVNFPSPEEESSEVTAI